MAGNKLVAMQSRRIMLWLAYAVWGLIVLAYLAFFLIDLRLDFDQLQVPCAGAGCNYLALSQTEMDVLAARGLSGRAYAVVTLGATVLSVGFSGLLGGLLLWRQGRSLIGWSVSLAMIIMPIATIADANNVSAHFPNLAVPTVILSIMGIAALFLFFYLFPSGKFYPHWGRIPYLISFLFFATYLLDFAGVIALSADAEQWIVLVNIVSFALPGAFQILRYRRVSTPIERQQTKWVVLGMVSFLIGFPFWLYAFGGLVVITPGLPRLLTSAGGWLGVTLMTAMMPVTIAISILRYRLWDIDLVIRRTLQYSILTGLLVLIYFGGVVVLQSIFSPLTGLENQPLVTVITTLGIAALFNPLRIRVQNFIDRRFYRKKYNAEKALAQFAATARDEVDMEKLTVALLDVVSETVQPDTITIWLKDFNTKTQRYEDKKP